MASIQRVTLPTFDDQGMAQDDIESECDCDSGNEGMESGEESDIDRQTMYWGEEISESEGESWEQEEGWLRAMDDDDSDADSWMSFEDDGNKFEDDDKTKPGVGKIQPGSEAGGKDGDDRGGGHSCRSGVRGRHRKCSRSCSPCGRQASGAREGRRASRADTSRVAWKSYGDQDNQNVLPPFTPNRAPGIDFSGVPHVMRNASDFFHLFFSAEMLNDICIHTNNYAYEQIAVGSYLSFTDQDGSWEATTPEELEKFITLLLYFDIVKVGVHADNYWSRKTLYHGLWARSILPRIRYRALMAFLHVIEPGTSSSSPEDKLRAIDQFVASFKAQCFSLYQPRQNIAIEERLVKSRQRSGLDDKPTRWGIKVWGLTDSFNGYTSDFSVYTGRGARQAASEKGLAYDVVMKLVEPFVNQGYCLFLDNFCTSLTLVKDLFALGVPATGLMSEHRREFPESLKKGRGWAKRLERGSMRWERDGPCLALQWVDSRVVSVVTTIDNANDKTTTHRNRKGEEMWGTVTIYQPLAIDRYTKHIGGVSLSDPVLGTYSRQKMVTCWKTLFFHLIDIAVVNAFTLFKEYQTNYPEALQRPAEYSIVDFREEIIRQICGLPQYGLPPAFQHKPPPGDYNIVHLPAFSENRRNCVVCYRSGRGEFRVHSYCTAPQCHGKHMHVIKDKNCFEIWHNNDYHTIAEN